MYILTPCVWRGMGLVYVGVGVVCMREDDGSLVPLVCSSREKRRGINESYYSILLDKEETSSPVAPALVPVLVIVLSSLPPPSSSVRDQWEEEAVVVTSHLFRFGSALYQTNDPSFLLHSSQTASTLTHQLTQAHCSKEGVREFHEVPLSQLQLLKRVSSVKRCSSRSWGRWC
jgi:hypothetical protein